MHIRTVNHEECDVEYKPQRILRGATGQQMRVGEISATRHRIFTFVSVFAIGMKIWPNVQIVAGHTAQFPKQ